MEFLHNLLFKFDTLTVIVRIILAALMGVLIGSERGKHGRAAGLRTHIWVCVGAAMTSLTSLYLSESLGFGGDVARLSAQVISGIGFLGAGTIMVRNNSIITGLTTAAGMWATAAIGIATGYGFYVGAAAATILGIFSVTVLSRLEVSQKRIVTVYTEINDITAVSKVLDIIKQTDKKCTSYDIIPPKSGIKNNVGLLCAVTNNEVYNEIKQKLEDINETVLTVCDINV